MPRTINTAIEAVPLNLLKPHPRNVNQGDFGAIQQSVETNGFYGTIVANKRTGHILAGNHRYAVAKAMHYTDVPVAWVDVDDEQELRILIADNRTTRLGIDNEASLTELLAELAATPTGLTGTGFDGDDLDALISSVTGADKTDLLTDPDEIPEDAPTRCNPGDLWQLGEHRLLCGDSSNAEHVERLMDGKTATMVFTDPPYGMRLETDYRKVHSNQELVRANTYDPVYGDDQDFDPRPILQQFDDATTVLLWGADWYYEKLPPGGSFVIWNKRTAEGTKEIHGNHFETCWSREKRRRVVYDHLWSGFTARNPDFKREHPTEKPIALLAQMICDFDSDADLIVDPFLGSGTTLIAAEQLGRKCYGIEIIPKYCDVIIERWERATGKTAVLLEAGNGTTD